MSINKNFREEPSNFLVENYVSYYGDSKEVQNQIDNCQSCGARLVLSHLPDYSNLFIQESSKCLECGSTDKKVFHVLN